MLISAEQRHTIVGLVRALTPGQLSTIVASLGEAGSQIATSRSSTHFTLLKTLSEWGLAHEVPLDVDMPAGIKAAVTSFAIDDDARADLAMLLDDILRDGGGS